MAVSVERQHLLQEIESQTFAQHAVDEAQRAATHAQAKWSDCSSTIGALQAEIEAIEDEPETSDRFIEQLAGGLDVIVESPVDELRKRLDAAEIESAVWHVAGKTAEQAIEARRHALDLARHRVADAARCVADSELNVAALLASAEAARQKALSELATLSMVMRLLPQASPRRQAVESFLQKPWCAPNAIENAPGGERHREWFEALRVDASAKMMN